MLVFETILSFSYSRCILFVQLYTRNILNKHLLFFSTLSGISPKYWTQNGLGKQREKILLIVDHMTSQKLFIFGHCQNSVYVHDVPSLAHCSSNMGGEHQFVSHGVINNPVRFFKKNSRHIFELVEVCGVVHILFRLSSVKVMPTSFSHFHLIYSVECPQ